MPTYKCDLYMCVYIAYLFLKAWSPLLSPHVPSSPLSLFYLVFHLLFSRSPQRTHQLQTKLYLPLPSISCKSKPKYLRMYLE